MAQVHQRHDEDVHAEIRRLLVGGLTTVGLLIALGWALVMAEPGDPAWLQAVAGDGPLLRIGVWAASGALAGCLAALAVVAAALRR